jgi:hypothetical protein
MLAWDALRHHLGHDAPALMDPQQPFWHRAEMFLELTSFYHKDKVSQTSKMQEYLINAILEYQRRGEG